MRASIKYLLIRLGIFAVALAIMLVLRVNPYLSAIVAALASFVISYIFFRGVRESVARELAARSQKPAVIRNADTDAEDDALDRLD